MNPVIAAAAVKAGKEAGGYASKVGQAVIDSPQSSEEMEKRLHLPKGSIQKMADGKDDPKLSTVIGIADILGTNLDKLTGYVNKNAERARQERDMKKSLDEFKNTLSIIDTMSQDAQTTEIVKYTTESVDRMLEQSDKMKAADRVSFMKSNMRTISMNLEAVGKVRPDPKTQTVVDYSRSALASTMDIAKDPAVSAGVNKDASVATEYELKKEAFDQLAEAKGLHQSSGFDVNQEDLGVSM